MSKMVPCKGEENPTRQWPIVRTRPHSLDIILGWDVVTGCECQIAFKIVGFGEVLCEQLPLSQFFPFWIMLSELRPFGVPIINPGSFDVCSTEAEVVDVLDFWLIWVIHKCREL